DTGLHDIDEFFPLKPGIPTGITRGEQQARELLEPIAQRLDVLRGIATRQPGEQRGQLLEIVLDEVAVPPLIKPVEEDAELPILRAIRHESILSSLIRFSL